MKRTLMVLGYLLALTLYLAAGWIPGLVLLLLALLGTARALLQTVREVAPYVRCPAGHLTPTYGRTRCTVCGFVGEGSVWNCSECAARYGHTPCPTCGLSIRNPSL